MSYGNHNFIVITQQTKLRVAPVALVTSSVLSRAVRLARIWAYALEVQMRNVRH